MTFEEFYNAPFPDWPDMSLSNVVDSYVSEYVAGSMNDGIKAVREEIEKLFIKAVREAGPHECPWCLREIDREFAA